MMIAIRTSNDPAAFAAQVRHEIAAVDPTLPPADVRPLEALERQTTEDKRTIVSLLAGFAAAALALAALGLYGTLSYSVARRTREIGIRVALGAPMGGIRRLVVGQGLVLSGVGILLGSSISVGLGRLLESQLYGVSSTDPMTLCGVSLLLFFVGAASCLIPANHAARIEPITALRME
jgi:putative ABC transport system permease protein